MRNPATKTLIVFLCAVISIATVSCSKQADTPDKAFAITKKAVLKNDWNTYWNMLSSASREKFDKQVSFMQVSFKNLPVANQQRMLDAMGMTEQQMLELDGRSFFISMQKNEQRRQAAMADNSRDLFKSSVVIKREVDGGHAVLYIEDEEGHTAKLPLIREDGSWKFDLAQMYSF
ncbi:MAG: hypothetical protein RBU23_03300 [Candidatus Auribacterota bacterium]|jgi:hypothetical protein|nr:hypothetical protein [Candidatus Auribacterota bacterium]